MSLGLLAPVQRGACCSRCPPLPGQLVQPTAPTRTSPRARSPSPRHYSLFGFLAAVAAACVVRAEKHVALRDDPGHCGPCRSRAGRLWSRSTGSQAVSTPAAVRGGIGTPARPGDARPPGAQRAGTWSSLSLRTGVFQFLAHAHGSQPEHRAVGVHRDHSAPFRLGLVALVRPHGLHARKRRLVALKILFREQLT